MNNLGTRQYWSMTEGVFNCLIDQKRTRAFAKAIKNTVKIGDIVVDMGTGSGILAMLAVKAGAKRVYAVELDTNNIKTLEATFRRNNLADKITIINANILTVKLPEKVDVVIGEMIATALIEELQVEAMNHILKFAKKGVRVLLNTYDTFIDVVYNKNIFNGLHFDILRYEYPDEKELRSVNFSQQTHIAHYDFSKPVRNKLINITKSLKITKNGKINGIRLSGKTTFYDKSVLGATFAYDYPLILPLREIVVKKNDILNVRLRYKVSGGLETLKYNIE